jgi:3-methyladenine DNA glycosylase AlkD
MTENIRQTLFQMRDEEYRDFQIKLIPGIAPETVIGVRTPDLRRYAAELYKSSGYGQFLKELPHRYFDENQLHAFIISEIKNPDICLNEVNEFLPYIDNWATCDQLSPKCFTKIRENLLINIEEWIRSDRTYTVRFATGMLMKHFLDENFELKYAEKAAEIRSDEYYVKMMVAWYFATALAKQYESIVPFIESRRLDEWTHNKAIQKAVESYRITADRKEYLKTLKIKVKNK